MSPQLPLPTALLLPTAFLVACVSSSPLLAQVRSTDGSGNNVGSPGYGQANNQFSRSTPIRYGDGVGSLATFGPSGAPLPNPRSVSNAVSAQAGSILDPGNRSDFVWQWGQFLDHDITLTDEGTVPEVANISIPSAADPLFPVIPFDRSGFTGGTTSPRQQSNKVTGWIDGSMIYGSDATRSNNLRTGVGGTLALTSTPNGQMLIYNGVGEENQNPTPLPATSLFLSGDERANEQVGLTAMHTVWMREHNLQAALIQTTNPTWSDEDIFQEARRIVIAEIQAITYKEYLPALLGSAAPSVPMGNAYDPTIDPSITNEFATAAFRLGHTQVSPELLRLDPVTGVDLGSLSMASAFFQPMLFTSTAYDEAATLLKGMSTQIQQRTDLLITDELRNMLFGPPGAGGMDLAALNIQRGRDHGLGTYNDARNLFGVGLAATWADITSDLTLQAALASVYGSVDDIDLWVGLLAEDPIADSVAGSTMTAMLADQFNRLMLGDRFFFLWDPGLEQDQRMSLMNTRLSEVILRNTSITALPLNVFIVPEPSRALLLLLGFSATALRRRRLQLR